MKRFVMVTFILLALCSVVCAEDGYVRLAIKGTNVNLRPEPQAGGRVVAEVNTGDIFIAEKWPVTGENDGSKWYRIVFLPDPNTGGIVLFGDTFSYYDAELEAEVSLPAAFVSAQFADAAPLAAGDMERIMELPAGEGFSALDTSPENQRRMALDNGGVYDISYTSGLFPEGSDVKEYAVYRGPSVNSGQKKYPITGKNYYFDHLVTDKSNPGWLQIISQNSWFSSGWIEANPEVSQSEDFSLGEFMTLCLGANVPEIVRKWGPGEIVSRSAYWTEMSFNGLKVGFKDHRSFGFTLTRRGAGMGGIFIGESWCDKDYLKRVFTHFSPEEIEAGQWRLQSGRDGWIYNYEIVFDADGLVRELHFNCDDVNLN